MKKIIFVIPVVCMLFFGCAAKEKMVLKETPQVYVLSSEELEGMPTVTLHENGNAWLSQPFFISSIVPGSRRYELHDNELSVFYGKMAEAVFVVSDGGDTLTLKSSNLISAKVGSVYKYRSNDDYLKDYNKVDGEKLTVKILREMVKNKAEITFNKFQNFEHVEINEEEYVLYVEGKYTLRAYIDADGYSRCIISRNSNGDGLVLNNVTLRDFNRFIKKK